MRIISGIYKNREFSTPDDIKTHPMGNREKLALFNMLLPYLSEKIVLDAFSGSGALGFESLSRGAKRVVFVEKNKKITKTIKNNCETLKIPPETYEILAKDVNKLDLPSNKFDIVLADPPYDNFKIEEIKNLVNFLKPDGILALSSPKVPDLNEIAPELSALELLSSHTYAAARISLFKKI